MCLRTNHFAFGGAGVPNSPIIASMIWSREVDDEFNFATVNKASVAAYFRGRFRKSKKIDKYFLYIFFNFFEKYSTLITGVSFSWSNKSRKSFVKCVTNGAGLSSAKSGKIDIIRSFGAPSLNKAINRSTMRGTVGALIWLFRWRWASQSKPRFRPLAAILSLSKSKATLFRGFWNSFKYSKIFFDSLKH